MKPATITQQTALELAERCAHLLRERFGARRVVLFGSAAGDAPWHERSDLDLAVEGLAPELYWIALNACYEVLPPGLELDLVLLETAWPTLRERLIEGKRMPKDPVQALAYELAAEREQLERVVGTVQKYLDGLAEEPDELEVRGFASLLHDFYQGCERIFERIALRIDDDLPSGPNWHTLLLQRMARPWGEERPAVINQALEQKLLEYLRFRHLFRHTYGYDLQWERIRELSEALSGLWQELSAQLTTFLAELRARQHADTADADD